MLEIPVFQCQCIMYIGCNAVWLIMCRSWPLSTWRQRQRQRQSAQKTQHPYGIFLKSRLFKDIKYDNMSVNQTRLDQTRPDQSIRPWRGGGWQGCPQGGSWQWLHRPRCVWLGRPGVLRRCPSPRTRSWAPLRCWKPWSMSEWSWQGRREFSHRHFWSRTSISVPSPPQIQMFSQLSQIPSPRCPSIPDRPWQHNSAKFFVISICYKYLWYVFVTRSYLDVDAAMK